MIIYSFTNKINGKKYIGQTTKTLHERCEGHRKCAKNHFDRKFYNAINKYGWDNFEIKIECYCNTIEELNKKETEYIIKYDTVKNGYNMGYGGDNNVMFCKETREKHDSKMRSVEVRSKISQSIKALRAEKGFSKETRKKISDKLKGNQHGKGKTRPIEAIINTARKNYKPVYCINTDYKIVESFPSVKAAAAWWFKNDLGNKAPHEKIYCDIIKDCNKKKSFIKGLYWIYGKPCVETIETIKKEVE